MNNQVSVPINYLITFLVEVVFFSIFVYIVLKKTRDETLRRWKVSVFAGVATGFIIQTIIFGLGLVGWLMQVKSAAFFESLITYFFTLLSVFIVLESLVIMPIIILSTFIAYFQFENSGDRIIEKYCKNPKIHYSTDQKPPFF